MCAAHDRPRLKISGNNPLSPLQPRGSLSISAADYLDGIRDPLCQFFVEDGGHSRIEVAIVVFLVAILSFGRVVDFEIKDYSRKLALYNLSGYLLQYSLRVMDFSSGKTGMTVASRSPNSIDFVLCVLKRTHAGGRGSRHADVTASFVHNKDSL
jgi:hypothetical protein